MTERQTVQDLMGEFLVGYEWEILKTEIEQKKLQATGALAQADSWDKALRFQERIRALEFLLKLPHELARRNA